MRVCAECVCKVHTEQQDGKKCVCVCVRVCVGVDVYVCMRVQVRVRICLDGA